MPGKLPFKQISEEVDIYAVAKSLGLKIVNDRAYCTTCESDRALEFLPETNTFRCWSGEPREPGHKCLTGDCITLYAHIKGMQGMYPAAKALWEQFLSGKVPDREAVPATSPQKPEDRKPSTSTAASARPKTASASFDPDAYAAKLGYTEEVEALGISQEDAQELGIGWSSSGLHKGIAFALRWPSGEIAGFCSVISGEVKLPKKLIPPKVHYLKRPA